MDNETLTKGIQKQIEAASPIIAECLRKGNDCELRIDTFGHLAIVEVRKHKISDKRF